MKRFLLCFAVVEWMSLLLPLCVGKGVCIITNMGAGNHHLLVFGSGVTSCIILVLNF